VMAFITCIMFGRTLAIDCQCDHERSPVGHSLRLCYSVSNDSYPWKPANVPQVTDSVRTLSRTQIDTLIVPGAFLLDDVTRDRDLVR
jgi:hypothetical protein